MAVATVGLVAVVAAGGFVGLVRWAPGPAGAQGERPGVVDEEPPDELAGGHELPPTPEGVADAAEGPVVTAATLEELPEGAHCPDGEVDWTTGPKTRWVLVTPDGVQARLVGVGRHRLDGPSAPPPPPQPQPGEPRARPGQPDAARPPSRPDAPRPPGRRPDEPADAQEPVAFEVTCQAEWDGARWRGSGGSVGRAEDAAIRGGGHMSGASCCDADGLGTAHAEVPVGDEVAWVLQDRGSYWLAYPTEGLSVVTVTWRFRPGGFGGGPGFGRDAGAFGEAGMGQGETFVRLLDEDADVVDERWIG